MTAALSLRAALKRGALVTAANWPVVLLDFAIETLYKFALTVPVAGGALLVAAVLGGDVRGLVGGGVTETVDLALATLADAPLAREQYKLYGHDNLARPPRAGKLDAIINHMGNFLDCVRSRQSPLSDVVSQHRSVSTCHLANISMRLGRKLQWNPEAERFVGDAEADTWLSRPQRKGFEIEG